MRRDLSLLDGICGDFDDELLCDDLLVLLVLERLLLIRFGAFLCFSDDAASIPPRTLAILRSRSVTPSNGSARTGSGTS